MDVHRDVGRVHIVALDADRVPAGPVRVERREAVRAHDERRVRGERQVLRERGRLVDVVAAKQARRLARRKRTRHTDGEPLRDLHPSMRWICDRLMREAGEEALADERILDVVRRCQSGREEKSGDGEQRSCRTHGGTVNVT